MAPCIRGARRGRSNHPPMFARAPRPAGASMKSNSIRRYAAVLGLVSLAACSVNLAFDIAKDAEVVSTQGSVATAIPVDLSKVEGMPGQKGNIGALFLGLGELTVTAVESDNSATS